MATTDLHFVAGSLQPVKRGVRFLGGDVNDQIQIDAAAVAAKAHAAGTFSAWIMVPDNAGTYTVISFGDANVVEYIQFSVENGKLFASCCDNTTMQWDTNSTNEVIVPHKWHHVALVQDGTRPIFYVDGVKVAHTDTTTTSLGVWGAELGGLDSGSIGAAEITGDAALTNEFKGYMCQVKYWKTALTAAQVKNDYDGKADVATDATNLQNSYDMEYDFIDDGLGADNGTAVGDIIFSDGNEFSSRLTFLETVPLAADNVTIMAEKGVGYAYSILAA